MRWKDWKGKDWDALVNEFDIACGALVWTVCFIAVLWGVVLPLLGLR